MAKKGPTKICEKCGARYHPRKAACPKCKTANPSARRAARKAAKTRSARRAAKNRGATVRARKAKTAAAARRASGSLDAAIDFVERSGGLDQAKKALDKIEMIKKL